MTRFSKRIIRWTRPIVFASTVIMALSGVMLRTAPGFWLSVHLLGALLAGAGLIAFLQQHWLTRRRQVTKHPNVGWGYMVLSQLIGLGLSGLALIVLTNFQLLRSVHAGFTLTLLFPLIVHSLWRAKFNQRPFAPRAFRPVFLTTVSGIALACFAQASLALPASTANIQSSDPTRALIHSGLGEDRLVAATDCRGCHSDLVAQWQASAHANAATDTYYLAVAGLLIQERGIEAARYCAACHNPIGLMRGEIDRSAAQPATQSANAYTARSLGLNLSISDRAAEGVTCVICHRANRAAAQPLNGSLTITAAKLILPSDPFSQFALRVAPASHAAELMPAVIGEAELCGSCHNLYLPAEGDRPDLAVEPTFDEWLDSPYPARGITCQTCHMPAGLARSVDSDLPASTATHGGLPGAPSSLPLLAKDPALLRTAATMAVRLESSAPERLIATIMITNSGAGHYLPTGAADLRQMWLEASLSDSTGQMVWHIGVLDRYGQPNADAVQFRKVLGDNTGRPIDLHRIWVTTRILEDTRLAPEESRQFTYQIDLPQAGRGPYVLSVRLRYRDVSQSFAEFALERPAPDLPIHDMAIASAILD